MAEPVVIPFFVRVLGWPDDLKRQIVGPSGLADPSVKPMLIVSFFVDNVSITGWYSPEHDVFMTRDGLDGVETEEPRVMHRDSVEHSAALQTIDRFREDLAAGGTPNMGKLETPPNVQPNRRLRR